MGDGRLVAASSMLASAIDQVLANQSAFKLTTLELNMVKFISRHGHKASRYLLVAIFSGALVSCSGGGSGDGDDGGMIAIGDQDADGDLIINSEDDDADGDGILDIEDSFVDLDGDGFDDITLLTQAEIDEAESGGDGFTEVSAENVCGSEAGSDNNSSNNDWNDNCVVRRSTIGGQFADSLFSVGIQRVLFCSGFGEASSYTVFADGEYGPGSEAAMISFQSAEGLVDDGIVGPASWAALQDRVELLVAGTLGSTPDTYGFTTGPCENIALFYQEVSATADSLGIIRGAWTLARNIPNQAEAIPFSFELPFGRL